MLAYIDQLGAPFVIGEIWRPLGLPRTAVNRVLDRLHRKGVVTRHPIPHTLYKTGTIFLYELAEEFR